MAIRGQLLRQEPLSRYTSLKVGGVADYFAVPEDREDLLELLSGLARLGMPWVVIGGGYNLLVGDGGFRGAVISLRKLNRIQMVGGTLRAEAGASTRDVAAFARDRGLAGLEFLAGIPGSLGGALRMNAGAHGGETLELVSSLELIGATGPEIKVKTTLNYGYRSLQLEHNKIIISADFLCPGDAVMAISQRMEACLLKRRETQQVGFPNAGSFFKNPPGGQAWRLIDAAGLRGACVGGAQVSEVHANFLVNRGGATAADFLQLSALIKRRVQETAGVELEEEVRIVGDM